MQFRQLNQQLKAATAVALVAISGMAMAAPDHSTVASRDQRMDEALQNYRSAHGTSGVGTVNTGSDTAAVGTTDNRGTGRFARAEEATKRGLHRAGNAIERGAQKTGDAITRVGEKMKQATGGDQATNSAPNTTY